ncbi:MazG-like family protein [Streptomyces winkii]|uniref:MazG-like family protein n=1 Tax=Streptomyces winkii TaxID=3051178 RepID=UPI0028D271E4|nr:MazG-like family protein [Streptomyces sp. DSM 40971]
MTPDQWATIRRLVEWLDSANGDGERETAMRLMKLAEESGEVMQAYIGATGQNPRKGLTHTPADVAAELWDVILTAAVALHRFTDDPAGALESKIREVARRSLPPQPPRAPEHPNSPRPPRPPGQARV